MIKNIQIPIFILLISFFIGCQKAPEPTLYIWDDYTNTSTEYGMNGQEKEVVEKHAQELNKIIKESEEKDQRVAPGIYAEYGQILFETSKKEEAKKYFLLEKKTYPESTQFINRVLNKLYGDTLWKEWILF